MSKRIVRSSDKPITTFDQVVPDYIENGVAARPKQKAGRISFRAIQQSLEELRAEAKAAGREEGHVQGYAEGERIGRTLGQELALAESLAQQQEILAQFVADLDEVAQAMRGAMDAWFVQAEQALLPLVTGLAAKVVASELETRPEAVREIVKQAVSEISHAATARIFLNPSSFKVLQGREAELMALAPSLKNLEFVLDPNGAAGCMIDTEGGRIDARIETKLASVAEIVEEAA